MIKYEIPIKAISLHTYYSLGKNRQFITKKGREYQQSIKDYLHFNYRQIFPHPTPVKLYIEFGLTNKRKNDVDNMLKPLLDALNGIFYTDDSLVYDLHVRKFVTDSNYINIEISELII